MPHQIVGQHTIPDESNDYVHIAKLLADRILEKSELGQIAWTRRQGVTMVPVAPATTLIGAYEGYMMAMMNPGQPNSTFYIFRAKGKIQGNNMVVDIIDGPDYRYFIWVTYTINGAVKAIISESDDFKEYYDELDSPLPEKIVMNDIIKAFGVEEEEVSEY